MSAYQMTESLLYDYKKYMQGVELKKKYSGLYITKCKDVAEKYTELVEDALYTITDDDYAGIIDMYYFERRTLEYIAEYYDKDIKTIANNKKRLVNDLKYVIFPDEVIKEKYGVN